MAESKKIIFNKQKFSYFIDAYSVDYHESIELDSNGRGKTSWSRSFGRNAACLRQMMMNWLVVEPTLLENISQIGSFPQVGVNIKHV